MSEDELAAPEHGFELRLETGDELQAVTPTLRSNACPAGRSWRGLDPSLGRVANSSDFCPHGTPRLTAARVRY